MKRIVFLFCLQLAACGAVKCQSLSRSQALNYFLQSDSVRNLMAFGSNRTCWLYDSTGIAANDETCSTGKGTEQRFQWIKPSDVRGARTKDCAYYYTSCTRNGSGWLVTIRQACSGLVCQGLIINKKQRLAATSFIAFVN